MNWQVEYTPWAVEDLRGFSLCARTLVYGWIERHLAGCANPRRWGKGDQDGGRCATGWGSTASSRRSRRSASLSST